MRYASEESGSNPISCNQYAPSTFRRFHSIHNRVRMSLSIGQKLRKVDDFRGVDSGDLAIVQEQKQIGTAAFRQNVAAEDHRAPICAIRLQVLPKRVSSHCIKGGKWLV